MLELAFKYPPELFARGTLELQWPLVNFIAVAIVIGILVAIAAVYFAKRTSQRKRDFFGLWALRTVLLALLLFVLLDPRLVVETDEPVRGHLTVLIDDSLSMRIADVDGAPRSRLVEDAFAPGSGEIAKTLEQRFDTRYLKFADTVETVVAGEALRFDGARSDLAEALRRIAQSQDAGALAAVVLVSDGAFADSAGIDDAVRALTSAGVALHAVGVGAERWKIDLEVSEVVVPRRVLRGDRIEAEIKLSQRGLAGQTATLMVEEESAIVAERSIVFPQNDRPLSVRVPLELNDAGPRRLGFRLAAVPGEMLLENNSTHRAVDVRGEPLRVLHIEGEPRFEVKFLRRAVAADHAIRLVSLVRTAEHKYYRLGVENADELAEGLPGSDEALFRYDAVVIGSIGNDLLDDTQQARLRDFVARRGGGLVMLGGRRAFAEGGYAGSTLAGLAPVEMPAAASAYRVRVPVRPSSNSAGDPLLRLPAADTTDISWDRLPALTVVNPIRRSKPGAVTLLEGDDGAGDPLVILAWQRYGRGTVAAFPVRDTWRWQMHADIPLNDQTHEQLWRNMLRHVARPAGSRARLDAEPAEAAAGERIALRAEVLDARFFPLSDAGVTLEVTTPLGTVEPIPLERSLDSAGFYQASLIARDIGRHEFLLKVEDANDEVIESRASVEVSSAGKEFHSAELGVDRLARISAATGGRFLRLNEAAKLVDVVDDTTATVRVEKSLPLRDAPGILLALIALACAEWLWRRRRGLA